MGGSGTSRERRFINENQIDDGETMLTWAQGSRFTRLRALGLDWIHVHNPAGNGDLETIDFDNLDEPLPTRFHFDSFLEAQDEGLAYLTEYMYLAFLHLRTLGFATSVYLGSPPYVENTVDLLGFPSDISDPTLASHTKLRACLDPWLRAGSWAFFFDHTGAHGTNSTTYHLRQCLRDGAVSASSPFTDTWASRYSRVTGVEAVANLPDCSWADTWMANYWLMQSAIGDPDEKQEEDATYQPVYLVRSKFGSENPFAQDASFLYDLVGDLLADGKRVVTRCADFDNLGYNVAALVSAAQ